MNIENMSIESIENHLEKMKEEDEVQYERLNTLERRNKMVDIDDMSVESIENHLKRLKEKDREIVEYHSSTGWDESTYIYPKALVEGLKEISYDEIPNGSSDYIYYIGTCNTALHLLRRRK